MLTTFIVDDEQHCRLNLQDALGAYANWSIIGEYADAKNLTEQVFKSKPDVIFLDVSMPGVNGIDAARYLTQSEHTPIIVFVTAYDQYAVEAFELAAIDYLLKPFDNARFQQCLNRIESLAENKEAHNTSLSVITNQSYLDQLVIRSASSLKVIPVSDITHLISAGNYVEIYHANGCDLHRTSLTSLLSFLNPRLFIRVHRTTIVNINCAQELVSVSESKNKLLLKSGGELPVSEKYKGTFIERWLEKPKTPSTC